MTMGWTYAQRSRWERCKGTWRRPVEIYEENSASPRHCFDMGMCFSCGHAYSLNGDGRVRKHSRPQGVYCQVGYHPGGCQRDGQAVPDNYRPLRPPTPIPTPAPTPASVKIHDRYRSRRVRVATAV